MSYVIDALSNYTDTDNRLLVKNLYEGQTFSLGTVIPGVKTTKRLTLADMSITPQNGNGCSFNPSGGTTLDEIDVSVEVFKINEEYCPSSLEEKAAQLLMRAGNASDEQFVFGDVIVEEKAKNIRKHVELTLWNADTNNGNAFDGFSKLISSTTAGVNHATGVATSGLTDNALTELDEMLSFLNEDALTRDDVVIFLSVADFQKYRSVLRDKNYFTLGVGDMNNTQVLTHPHTNYRVVMTPGLVKGDIKIGVLEYMLIATDLMSDNDNIRTWYSQDDQVIKLAGKWRIGANIIYPSYFVSNT